MSKSNSKLTNALNSIRLKQAQFLITKVLLSGPEKEFKGSPLHDVQERLYKVIVRLNKQLVRQKSRKVIIAVMFLLSGCAGQSGVTPVGGGFGLINLGNPSVTRMDAWYQAPVQYQISHVHKIVQVLGDNGVRCNRPGVTVGFIRTELMTRANAGKYRHEDLLFDKTVEVLKDVC